MFTSHSGIHRIGCWVDPRACLYTVALRERERERERETCHSWKINPGLLARCSVTIVTEIFPLILELV